MTSKLKCPFCQQELIREGMSHWWCSCNIEHQGKELYGTTALWQPLIQAKQDLEIARKTLKDIDMLLHSRKFDITELGRLNIIQHLVSRALKATEHKE